MSKGIASIEQQQCPICTKIHDTGSVLLQRRVGTPRLNPYTVTDFELCPACAALKDEGYIALVELDGEPRHQHNMLRDTWNMRTGHHAHLRRSTWSQLFTMEEPPHPFIFVSKGVLGKLRELRDGTDGQGE